MHHDAPDRKDDRKIRCGERWRELSSTPRHLQSRDSENCGFRFLFFLKSPSNSLHFLVAVMVAMWILRCEVKRTIAARRLKDAKARSDKISACPWAAHGLPICQICQPCVIHVSNVQRIESYRVHDPCVQMARVVDLAQIWCDFVYRVEVLCERFQFQSRGKHSRKTERTAFLRSILKGYFWFSVRKKSAAFDWSTLTRWKNAAFFFQNIFEYLHQKLCLNVYWVD